MGIKNIIGELQVNGSPVVTEENLEDAVKIGLTSNTEALTDEEKASAAKWLGVPNAYEGDTPKILEEIHFDMNGTSYDINPEEYVHLVSDKTFTKDELLSETSPFYFDVMDTANNTTQTFSMADARFLEIEGGLRISKVLSSPTCTIAAYVVYDRTKCTISGWTPPSNGIYFIRCTYHNLRFDRLYREGKEIKKIDNIFLDLENNEYLNVKFGDIEEKFAGMSSPEPIAGLSETAKILILQLFKRAVFTDDCREYIKALADEFGIVTDAGGDAGGDTITVPAGYTLVRTVNGSQLTVGQAVNGVSPYYSTNTKRTFYKAFDISIPNGGTFKVDVKTADGVDVMVAYQGYTQASLDAMDAGRTINNTWYDSGWCSVDDEHTIPSTYNGSPMVYLRFSFKRIDETVMESNDIEYFSIFKKSESADDNTGGDENITIEIPEGYTLVRTIEESELSVGVGCTSNAPNYYVANNKRTSYIPFDISINGGIYNAIVETKDGVDVAIGYRAKTEKSLEEVNSSSKISTDYCYDDGWHTVGDDVIIPEMVGGSPIKGMRLTFKRTDETEMQVGDIKAVHLIKSNATPTDGYTLVHTIEENELSVGQSLAHSSPYYATNTKRTSYLPFDLSIEGGATYMVVIDAIGGSKRFAVAMQCYNQLIYDKQANGESWVLADLHDTNYFNQYEEVTIPKTHNNSPIVGARITLKCSTSDTTMSAGDITRIRIYKKEV